MLSYFPIAASTSKNEQMFIFLDDPDRAGISIQGCFYLDVPPNGDQDL
jgi:hypothetical protein